MSKKAELCYCLNTYTRTKCKKTKKSKCKQPHYWSQGIGKIHKINE